MLKKAAALSAIAIFALTSCAAIRDRRLPTPEELRQTIADVRAKAIEVCSFDPTEGTVASLIGVEIPGVSSALSLAKAICDAVSGRASSTTVLSVPEIAGVEIKGRRVTR